MYMHVHVGNIDADIHVCCMYNVHVLHMHWVTLVPFLHVPQGVLLPRELWFTNLSHVQ